MESKHQKPVQSQCTDRENLRGPGSDPTDIDNRERGPGSDPTDIDDGGPS